MDTHEFNLTLKKTIEGGSAVLNTLEVAVYYELDGTDVEFIQAFVDESDILPFLSEKHQKYIEEACQEDAEEKCPENFIEDTEPDCMEIAHAAREAEMEGE